MYKKELTLKLISAVSTLRTTSLKVTWAMAAPLNWLRCKVKSLTTFSTTIQGITQCNITSLADGPEDRSVSQTRSISTKVLARTTV